MGFLSRLFGKKDEQSSQDSDEHLVRLHIPLETEFGNAEQFDRWTALEDLLEEKAVEAKVGYLDGNEIGGNEYSIWLYGPQAGPLADLVEKTAREFMVPAGTTLFVRHGGVDDSAALEETRKVN